MMVIRIIMMVKRIVIVVIYGMFGFCVDFNYKKYNNIYMYLNFKLNSYY